MSLLQAISLKKITSWSFLITAYSFLFPFSLAVANIFLALFVVRWIADLYLGKVTCRKATIIDIIVYTLFFVTISLSVFYSLDKETGIKFVYRNLPLLFFPILLFTIILKNKSQIIFNSSLFFSIALFIINLFSLTGATINWLLSTNTEMGFLHNISLNKFSSAFITYDYLYLWLYISFSLLISSCLLISKKSKPCDKKFGYVSIPFFFISFFLIGGRNSILTSILIGTALMVYYGVTYKKIK